MIGKVVIATPIFGGAVGRYVASLVRTQRLLHERGIPHDIQIVEGNAYIASARNTLCLSFLAHEDAETLFFIDQDMGWEAEDFIRVLTADAPICGGSYPMKNAWDQWTANLVRDENGGLMGRAREDGTGHLIEAISVPMGFTKITRAALLHMRDKRREFDFPNPLNDEKFFHSWFATPQDPREGTIGEDVWFSREWRRIGGKLWVEPNVTLDHVGQKAWAGNLHETLMESQAAQREHDEKMAALRAHRQSAAIAPNPRNAFATGVSANGHMA